jgi:hypothetical protein
MYTLLSGIRLLWMGLSFSVKLLAIIGVDEIDSILKINENLSLAIGIILLNRKLSINNKALQPK